MAWAPYVIMAVGTALQMMAKREEAETQEAAAKFEAQQAERAAKTRRAIAQRQSIEVKRQGEFQQSRALAAAAASGASASDTGFSNLLADIAGETRYRQMVALYEGESGAKSFEEQAGFSRWSGKRIRRAGDIAVAATALKGASSMYSMYGGGGSPGGGGGYGFSGGAA